MALEQETGFVIEDSVLTEYNGNEKNVVVPDTVTVIAAYAFDGCIDMTSVVIPESVIEINSYAFNDCVNLADVSISKSIEELNKETFNGCKNITNVKIDGEILIDYHNDKDAPVLPMDVYTDKILIMNRILQFFRREFEDSRPLCINGVNIFDMPAMKEMQDKRARAKRRRKITVPVGWSLAATGAVIAFIGLFTRINSGGDFTVFLTGLGIFAAACIFTALN